MAEKKSMGYDEVNAGDVFESPARKITEEDIMTFADLTGDHNDIHVSEEFAKKSRFGTRIAHGMLIMGIANGMYVELGIFRNSVLMEIKEWKLKKPVKLGDEIRLRLTIESKRLTKKPDYGICEMRYDMVNQDDETVSSGILVRLVPVEK